MEILVERNQPVTIYFPMIAAGSSNFIASGVWTPASGDIQYSVDGGDFSAINVVLPTFIGNGTFSAALIAGEVAGKRTAITIIDSATKVVEDQEILIQTWGDDSAGLPFNAIADYVIRRGFQAMIDSSRGDTKSFRSLAGAIAKLVNKLSRSGSDLVITEDDDSTELGRQAMTTSAVAEVITDLDTT